jgi:integrase
MASLYQRGDVWWAKFRQGGKVVRVSTGCTKKRAAQDWIDVRAGKIAEGQPLPVRMDLVTYDELRADLDAAYAVKGIKSLVDAKRRMSYLDAAFKGWRAISITESAIDAYVAKRKTEKVPGAERLIAPATINRELAQLRRMLRLAYRRRKLAHMPTITMLPEAQPRQGFVEESDFRALVAHLPANHALAATIAYETAWRCRSEVLTLEWSRVDLEDGCIRLDGAHSKNGQSRTAYLSAATTKMLREQRARVEALGRQLTRVFPEVFVHIEKGPLQGRPVREFRKAWRRACRQAGRTGLLLHDLRRSGVRSLIRSGTPEGVAMKISGHKTRAIFDRYNIVSEADLREAAERRAQFGHIQAAKVVSLAR